MHLVQAILGVVLIIRFFGKTQDVTSTKPEEDTFFARILQIENSPEVGFVIFFGKTFDPERSDVGFGRSFFSDG